MLTDFESLVSKIESGSLRFLAISEGEYQVDTHWFFDEVSTSPLPRFRRLRKALETNPVVNVPERDFIKTLKKGGFVGVSFELASISYVTR